MSNNTPRGERVHIALFGKRNAGKSSVINAVTGQDISLVSDVSGTTTDPVYKSMEILPIGPVVIIDTAGIDDEGDLGEKRVRKSYDVLNKTDVAIIVIDSTKGISSVEEDLLDLIKKKDIPFLVVMNKIDLLPKGDSAYPEIPARYGKAVFVSCSQKTGVVEIKHQLIKLTPADESRFQIVGDLIKPLDYVVLVTPIDKAAPKGRLILPQQQVIRDILEADGICVVTKEHELRATLDGLKNPPRLVITDSQVFAKVSADVPKDILLTSFSILFARYKGDLRELIAGAKKLDKLKDGDKILMAEGCTHHRQSDDIGTVKIPRWVREYTGKDLTFDYVAGFQYPENISEYALIVHCGACMLNKREVGYRIDLAKDAGVDIVNYGVLIAFVQGILERVTECFF